MNTSSVIFSVDAETIGLYGDHFAFGWSLRDMETGKEIDSGYEACPSDLAMGTDGNRKWVNENVIRHLPKETTCNSTMELYQKVWQIWTKVKNKYDKVRCVADCAYPVETTLFRRCVELDLDKREFEGPFPLHEVATAEELAGIDPKDFPKKDDEKLEHHPTHDARYSGRLFWEACKKRGLKD